MEPRKVRITVVKKTVNWEFLEEYVDNPEAWTSGCCHDFYEGQEFITDGPMPEGFCTWTWSDIQKYVLVLARGGNMVGVKPGTFVTCCTDGFRPVFYKLERVEDSGAGGG